MVRKVLMLAITIGLSHAGFAQNLALSSNVLDIAGYGTANVEASLGVTRHWSLNAGGKYNPFSFGDGPTERFNRQRSLSVGARYWPWHVFSGWWLSGTVRCQEYSYTQRKSYRTSEGDRFGAGVAAGYSHMLGKHFNLDVGMGLWTGYARYKVYACQRCGRIMDGGDGMFLLPSDMLVAVSYIF